MKKKAYLKSWFIAWWHNRRGFIFKSFRVPLSRQPMETHIICLLQKQAILTAERRCHANTQDLQDSRPPQDMHPDPDRSMTTSSNTSTRCNRRRRKRRKTTRKLDTTTVINLSSVQLTQDEVNLLSLGLKVCPTPTHINWPEFKADISDFIRRLRLHEYFHDNNNNSSQQTQQHRSTT